MISVEKGVPDPRVIVALDYCDKGSVLGLLDQLTPDLCRLKVGKELFTSLGPAIVETLIARGFDVFLDLKFHDIPNTVAKAVEAAANMGVWMLNVHASGGQGMMEAARDAVLKSRHQPLLIAVTVLTSMDSREFANIGLTGSVEQQVLRLATLTRQCGLDGVVCSAREAALLRRNIEQPFCLVTPGIRPSGSSDDDQQRIVTPGDAISFGSDYLVVGRPVTRSNAPIAVLKAINAEIFTRQTQ